MAPVSIRAAREFGRRLEPFRPCHAEIAFAGPTQQNPAGNSAKQEVIGYFLLARHPGTVPPRHSLLDCLGELLLLSLLDSQGEVVGQTD
jgi:hypothetical protein